MYSKLSPIVALSVASILLLLVLSPSIATFTDSGYVTYNFSVSGPNVSKSLNVTESASPSSAASLSILNLTITGMKQKLDYSRLINSSSPLLFPYMITTGNQTLSYNYGNYSLLLSVTRSGSESISFNGTNYQLNDYSFTASVSTTEWSNIQLKGIITAFPSGLIYSVESSFNDTSLSVKLLSTNLALDPPGSGSMGQVEAIALSGAGIAGLAIALFFVIKKMTGSRAEGALQSKPSYWVD